MPITPDLHRFRSPLFESVVKQALDFFTNTPLQPLPPDDTFQGVGVYAIYLLQHDGLYRRIAASAATHPIYVGKAVPRGWRRGRRQGLSSSRALFRRLGEHARSIQQAQNLRLVDFQARFMILNGVESDLIVPVEAEMIRQVQPLWNTQIDGFGNHDPGSGRYNQSPSEWDVLHPGRPWVANLTGTRPDDAAVMRRVQSYLDSLDQRP